MLKERFLERLKIFKEDPEKRFSWDENRVKESILRHLEKLLNTRQGNAPIAEDYGVPDFTELLHTYPESIRDMERALRQAIRKYEPRLRSVRVRFVPQEEDPLTLRFEIVARLASDGDSSPVYFESVMGPDGKIRLLK